MGVSPDLRTRQDRKTIMSSFCLLALVGLFTSGQAIVYFCYGEDNCVGTQGVCCPEVTAGGKLYRFVGEFDTSKWNCISNCTYEHPDRPGSGWCFQDGDVNGGGQAASCTKSKKS